MQFTSKPLDSLFITQLFGANNVDFYKKLGLKGHNGIDFQAETGRPCYAVFDGTVTKASVEDAESLTAGRYVYIETDPTQEGAETIKYQVVYFHLEHTLVKTGDRVTSGQQVGTTDNTGQYTTGPHLHFGLYRYVLGPSGYTIDKNNGYGGAIDPEPYFQEGWIANTRKKQTNYDLFIFEGQLLKEESSPNVYLVQSGKIRLFPDEVTLWTNGYSLSQVHTVTDGAFEAADVGEPVKPGKAIDAQALKEMVGIFANEPDRAKQLFTKYF